MTAVERGPHKSALAEDTIAIIHIEMTYEMKYGFTEMAYLDEVEHLLGTDEWSHL